MEGRPDSLEKLKQQGNAPLGKGLEQGFFKCFQIQIVTPKKDKRYTFSERKAYARVDNFRPIGNQDLWTKAKLVIELSLRKAFEQEPKTRITE